MTDLRRLLADLRRPRMLIRAARHGLADYCRDRDLARLLSTRDAPCSARALPRLLTEEARMEADRQDGRAGYSLSRHIEVMIALLAEASLLGRDRAL